MDESSVTCEAAVGPAFEALADWNRTGITETILCEVWIPYFLDPTRVVGDARENAVLQLHITVYS